MFTKIFNVSLAIIWITCFALLSIGILTSSNTGLRILDGALGLLGQDNQTASIIAKAKRIFGPLPVNAQIPIGAGAINNAIGNSVGGALGNIGGAGGNTAGGVDIGENLLNWYKEIAPDFSKRINDQFNTFKEIQEAVDAMPNNQSEVKLAISTLSFNQIQNSSNIKSTQDFTDSLINTPTLTRDSFNQFGNDNTPEGIRDSMSNTQSLLDLIALNIIQSNEMKDAFRETTGITPQYTENLKIQQATVAASLQCPGGDLANVQFYEGLLSFDSCRTENITNNLNLINTRFSQVAQQGEKINANQEILSGRNEGFGLFVTSASDNNLTTLQRNNQQSSSPTPSNLRESLINSANSIRIGALTPNQRETVISASAKQRQAYLEFYSPQNAAFFASGGTERLNQFAKEVNTPLFEQFREFDIGVTIGFGRVFREIVGFVNNVTSTIGNIVSVLSAPSLSIGINIGDLFNISIGIGNGGRNANSSGAAGGSGAGGGGASAASQSSRPTSPNQSGGVFRDIFGSNNTTTIGTIPISDQTRRGLNIPFEPSPNSSTSSNNTRPPLDAAGDR